MNSNQQSPTHSPPEGRNPDAEGASDSLKTPDGTETSIHESPDSAATVTDNRFLLVIGGLFFAIMAGQYAWMVVSKPEPLRWEDGPASAAFKVDINSATWAEWSQLEDVGPELAMQIVADRNEHGEFRSIDDVGRVAGIGASTLDQNRPFLTMSKRPAKTPKRDGHSIEPAENQ